uniref:MULE transposase domain-containing protein n=1 Tax=Lactuca sativa TaxID=4236 RepID=A0A9R1VET2_LACSA|nr:hypothetical protein LSAT_V11C500253340 [Lactuca sativa]
MSYEEMEVINTDVLQSESSSDEGKMSKRRNKIWASKKPLLNDATQVSDPLYILQTFSSSQEAKDRIYLHSIETRRELDIVKNDKNRVRVVCKGTILDMGILETSGKGGPSKTSGKGGPSQRNINGGPSQMGEKGGPSKKKSAVKVDESNKCPWKLLISKWKKDDYWTVKTYEKEHKCLQTRKIKASGKRDFLGLDGAFMKGPYPGMILTTVGLDGNNCTYPVAYGVVESENYSSWTWFLKNLGDDLDLTTNSNFTFITDRQKELKKLKNDAYECLKAIPPQHWSRSHFTGRAHCDALLNNLCETLNTKLVKGHHEPIISCLEFIREYVMKKLVIV